MAAGRMVRVSSKGQIVLPKSFRDLLEIGEGDYLHIQDVGSGLLLVEKPGDSQLDAVTDILRERAEGTEFTREDLDAAIKEVRAAAARQELTNDKA